VTDQEAATTMQNRHLDVQRSGDLVIVGFRCAQIPDGNIIEEL
jgi:hypothetical protein